MDHKPNSLSEYFQTLGISEGQHILLHAAYRQIRSVFPGYPIEVFLKILMNRIGKDGSLIMPAFTYNFRREGHPDQPFSRLESPSRVGAVSETFRRMPEVIRTSAPTHSFCLWGRAAQEIGVRNAPASPLGAGSVLEWLAGMDHAFITMIGVDFSSLSFGHYLEHLAPVPWHDFSPWKHLCVLPIGVSEAGGQELHELPGCSQSFVRFEQHLIETERIRPFFEKTLRACHMPVGIVLEEGLSFFRERPQDLLCAPGTCKACDERWEFYLTSINTGSPQ